MHIDRAKTVFWFDGVCSDDLGVKVAPFPKFSAAEPRITKYSVPGRNGDLTYWDGSFENVTCKMTCSILAPEDIEVALTAVNRWMIDCGYKKLVISSDPGRYRIARLANAAEVAVRMGVLAPFTLEFDCKPQRFFDDETPLRFTGDTWNVLNSFGFKSYPRIRLYLEEGATYTSAKSIVFKNNDGENKITISALYLSGAKWVEIDTDERSVKTDVTDAASIYMDSSGYPSFCAGTTIVSGTDWATEIVVYPRWWTL